MRKLLVFVLLAAAFNASGNIRDSSGLVTRPSEACTNAYFDAKRVVNLVESKMWEAHSKNLITWDSFHDWRDYLIIEVNPYISDIREASYSRNGEICERLRDIAQNRSIDIFEMFLQNEGLR